MNKEKKSSDEKSIEIQNNKEIKRYEKITLLILVFFIIGAIIGLIVYTIYELESAVYLIPIITFVLAIMISLIL